MSLIDNYLIQVSRHLPTDKRDDIAAELRDQIEDALAERSAGATPTERDVVAVLERLGSPRKIARGYLPDRYLIGPALFPVFMRAWFVAVVAVLSLQIVLWLVASVTSGYTVSPLNLLKGLFDTAFMVSAVVAAVFAILEATGERLEGDAAWRAGSDKPATLIDASDVATNLITEGVFLLWWNGVLVFGQWPPFNDGALAVQLDSNWGFWFWPINVLVGAAFVLHLGVLMRGLWHRGTLTAELLLGLATLLIGVQLIAMDNLVTVTGEGWDISDHLQRTVRMMIVVIMGFTAWDIWLALGRLRQLTLQSEDALAAGHPGGNGGT